MEQQSSIEQVRLNPSKVLIFKGRHINNIASFTILNNSEFRICYKIKTTSALNFTINKPSGSISPISQTEISVIFLGPITTIDLNHKFLIVYQNCPEGTKADFNSKPSKSLRLSIKFINKEAIEEPKTPPESHFDFGIKISPKNIISFQGLPGNYSSYLSLQNSSDSPKSFRFTNHHPNNFIPFPYEGTIPPYSSIKISISIIQLIEEFYKGLELLILYTNYDCSNRENQLIKKKIIHFRLNTGYDFISTINCLNKSQKALIIPLIQLIPNDVLVFRKSGEKYCAFLTIKNNSNKKFLYKVIYSDELKNSFIVKPYEKIVDPKSEISVVFKYFGGQELDGKRENFLVDCCYVLESGN